MECGSSNNSHLQNWQLAEDKTRSSAMLDLDVFDCPICVEPFTIPIFQCDNGHLACDSCCPKLSYKCPLCALPVGHIRCRAMETVLESVYVLCRNKKFGCTKKIYYRKESSTHEKECEFSPCSCPLQDCDYTGSYKDLYSHYHVAHQTRKSFLSDWLIFGIFLTIQMNISDKILIKWEHMMKLLFVVQCFREPYGVYVTVSCTAPSSPVVGEFSYNLSYTVDGHTITYESPEVKKVLQVSFQTPQENFMLIPNSLLCGGDLLEMKIRIKNLNQE